MVIDHHSDEALRERIWNTEPCIACAHSGTCLVLSQHRSYTAPEEHPKLMRVIASCNGFVQGLIQLGKRTIRAELSDRDMRHVCGGCDSSSECATNASIADVTKVAAANNLTLDIFALCITEMRPRLMQIAEPSIRGDSDE